MGAGLSSEQAARGPVELFDRVLRQSASTPFVTYYNELTGERAELSARSLGNWVAKTHSLLLDSLGLGPGDQAQVRVAADWLAPAILLGVWCAGVSVRDDGADVAIVDAATLPRAADAQERFAVQPASLSRSWGATPPAGAEDFVGAVRPQPDAWASVRPASGERAVVDDLGVTETVAIAQSWVEAHGVGPNERLLFDVAAPAASSDAAARYPRPQDWIPLLLAPLLVGGSVVYVAGAPESGDGRETLLTRRAEQERARVVQWT